MLLGERAAYWAARRTLIVADLHLGKSETLGVRGVPLPAGIAEEQIARLDRACEACAAARLLVLGDLLHAPAGLIPSMIETVGAWRRSRALEMVVVPGNHDRKVEELAAPWGLTIAPATLSEGPFDFVHEPRARRGRYTLSGHLHPVVRLRRGGDSLRLPCFHVGESVSVLPAFSQFTGGCPIEVVRGDRVFAVADGGVLEL